MHNHTKANTYVLDCTIPSMKLFFFESLLKELTYNPKLLNHFFGLHLCFWSEHEAAMIVTAFQGYTDRNKVYIPNLHTIALKMQRQSFSALA